MIKLEPGEKQILMIRRHWFVLAKPLAFFFAALVFPTIFLKFAPSLFPALAAPDYEPMLNFFLTLYFMGLFLFLFIFWVNYYLDVWIVTTHRLIDIEQKSLFSREIAEMRLSRIENVTVEVSGFIQTMLGFGDIKVETAGVSRFIIKDAPRYYEVKNALLRHQHATDRARQGQQNGTTAEPTKKTP
ncbi:MAG: PH domain-containing protein [bacterium]|nr:PH domain-containing protein [bacterium]